MRFTKLFISFAAILVLAGLQTTSLAAETKREAVFHPAPPYPPIMKQNSLGMVKIVKVQITVSPQGAVKTATVLGGDAVLSQFALETVRQWKYVPADSESVLVVEFRFNP